MFCNFLGISPFHDWPLEVSIRSYDQFRVLARTTRRSGRCYNCLQSGLTDFRGSFRRGIPTSVRASVYRSLCYRTGNRNPSDPFGERRVRSFSAHFHSHFLNKSSSNPRRVLTFTFSKASAKKNSEKQSKGHLLFKWK